MRILTVNLTDQSEKDLDRAAALAGDSLTDTVNRAIQIYNIVLDAARANEGDCTAIREIGTHDLLCFTCLPTTLNPSPRP